jgi:hypothetical protein
MEPADSGHVAWAGASRQAQVCVHQKSFHQRAMTAIGFPIKITVVSAGGWPIGTSVTSGSSSRTGRGETAVTEMVVTAWDCEPVALRETTLGALIDCGPQRGRQSFWAQGRGKRPDVCLIALRSKWDGCFRPVRSGGALG